MPLIFYIDDLKNIWTETEVYVHELGEDGMWPRLIKFPLFVPPDIVGAFEFSTGIATQYGNTYENLVELIL